METQHTNMSEIRLQSDVGGELVFKGRIFSECSWYDEEYGVQMRQKLYVADNRDQIYYIGVPAKKNPIRPTGCLSPMACAPSITVSRA